jgi:hypothetical protein
MMQEMQDIQYIINRDSKITITPDMMHKYYKNLDMNKSSNIHNISIKNSINCAYRIIEIKIFIIIVLLFPICIYMLSLIKNAY